MKPSMTLVLFNMSRCCPWRKSERLATQLMNAPLISLRPVATMGLNVV